MFRGVACSQKVSQCWHFLTWPLTLHKWPWRAETLWAVCLFSHIRLITAAAADYWRMQLVPSDVQAIFYISWPADVSSKRRGWHWKINHYLNWYEACVNWRRRKFASLLLQSFGLITKKPRGFHSNWHLRIALPPIFCSQITKTWDQYDCTNSCADTRCATQCPLERTLIYCIYTTHNNYYIYYILYTYIEDTRADGSHVCWPLHTTCIPSTFRLCSPSKLIVLRRYSRGWEWKHLGL
jgi:hypothetical protein